LQLDRFVINFSLPFCPRSLGATAGAGLSLAGLGRYAKVGGLVVRGALVCSSGSVDPHERRLMSLERLVQAPESPPSLLKARSRS
jgi:hypothetical protein